MSWCLQKGACIPGGMHGSGYLSQLSIGCKALLQHVLDGFDVVISNALYLRACMSCLSILCLVTSCLTVCLHIAAQASLETSAISLLAANPNLSKMAMIMLARPERHVTVRIKTVGTLMAPIAFSAHCKA